LFLGISRDVVGAVDEAGPDGADEGQEPLLGLVRIVLLEQAVKGGAPFGREAAELVEEGGDVFGGRVGCGAHNESIIALDLLPPGNADNHNFAGVLTAALTAEPVNYH
jgi:hypothetical protein